MQEQYHNIRFHFFSGDGYDVTERLDRGLIDFGTLIEPIDMSRYDYLRLPRPDTWGVLMRKDHPLAKLERIRPEHLQKAPLISSRQMTEEEGMGCLLTLDQLVTLPAGGDLCFRPLEPKLESWMYLAWKKYQVFTNAAEVFLKRLRQEVRLASDD